MRQHQALDDRQAEPEPARRAIGGLALLHELVEDLRQVLAPRCRRRRRSTRSSAVPPSARAVMRMCPPAGVYLDALTSRFEITCARRAASPSTHSGWSAEVRPEQLPLPLERRACGLHRHADGLAQVEPFLAQFDLARGDSRHVHQVVDQPHQMFGLALDDRALLLEDIGAAQPHHMQRGDDRRQRVAQFVAEHRQEVVLRAVRPVGLAARLGQRGDVVDDDDDAAGPAVRPERGLIDELEEPLVRHAVGVQRPSAVPSGRDRTCRCRRPGRATRRCPDLRARAAPRGSASPTTGRRSISCR